MAAAAAHHHLEGQVERNPERRTVVRLVAGSTDSMPYNSDTPRKRHKDLGRRSIERSWQRNPSDCWLQGDRASLGSQRPLETALLHMTRSHRHSLDDRPLAGSRNHVVAVDSP